jgi:hypothetical protein
MTDPMPLKIEVFTPDITYCPGNSCERKEQCSRWTGHLTGHCAAWVSVSDFAQHNEGCEYFLEKEGGRK